MNILICDPISKTGIEYLRQQPGLNICVLEKRLSEAELIPIVSDVHAILVRSETKVTRAVMAAAPNLRVVGRAGVGVDNVDVEAATQRGVVVMNTPAGNTISTAELAFSMILSLARKIPQAHMSMKGGQWDRKQFSGAELSGKTLGVLGMGRIGTQVARRAIAFGMRVLAYDPFLSVSKARSLQVELLELGDLFAKSDYITVHMPLTDETRNMINAETMQGMKKGVGIVNCARGGIVNEIDLVACIRSGHVGSAALDVYEQEPLPADSPLRAVPEIVMTPHLGASTKEAQDSVGLEVAEAVTDFLNSGTVRNAVNMPSLDAKTMDQVRPYLSLGGKMGRLLAQLMPKRKDKIVITYGGKATEVPTDPVTRSILLGLLQPVGGSDVNMVNVREKASGLGLIVEEIKKTEGADYNEWLHIAVISGEQRITAGGTFFGASMKPRIVRLYSQPVEIVPEGVLLVLTNKDRPGMVGYIGTLLGKHNVNIANMSLGREQVGGEALTVLNLDSVPVDAFLSELRGDKDISNVRVVTL